MPIICALCRRDGLPFTLREDDEPGPSALTYGLCERHSSQVLADLRRLLRSIAGLRSSAADAAA
jgi:hypothetical protein